MHPGSWKAIQATTRFDPLRNQFKVTYTSPCKSKKTQEFRRFQTAYLFQALPRQKAALETWSVSELHFKRLKTLLNHLRSRPLDPIEFYGFATGCYGFSTGSPRVRKNSFFIRNSFSGRVLRVSMGSPRFATGFLRVQHFHPSRGLFGHQKYDKSLLRTIDCLCFFAIVMLLE